MHTTIESPIHVYLPRKTMPARKMSLNLNDYRNWHYVVSNQVKTLYTEQMSAKLAGLKFEKKINITFGLWKSSRRVIDSSNFTHIVEKFFCDALVAHGCIPNDDDQYIGDKVHRTLGIDAVNPRVEITITEQ